MIYTDSTNSGYAMLAQAHTDAACIKTMVWRHSLTCTYESMDLQLSYILVHVTRGMCPSTYFRMTNLVD